MKIHDLTESGHQDSAAVSATITWEDCDRSEQEVFFRTDARFADGLSCNPNAFLLAAFIPAMSHGERRIVVEGKVCPEIRNGLATVRQLLQRWYGEPGHQPVTIEATGGFEPPPAPVSRRTISFMSGGVDSIATLRSNRQDFALSHPCSIRDCFFVHGFDIGGYEKLDANEENFELTARQLSKLAEEAEVTLIPVHTNLRHLEGEDAGPYNNRLFSLESHGAALAAVAHAFSRRITTALIASSFAVDELAPWGSHPLLDPNYSSADVRVQHDGTRLSRLEKVGLIAGWGAALQTIRSCLDPLRPGGVMNCGRCEKCIRTMVELLIFGRLKDCTTYPADDVTPELVRSLRVSLGRDKASALITLFGARTHFWRPLVAPLRNIGRHDLAAAIDAKLSECDKYRARMEWKIAVEKLDRRYLGGTLSALRRLTKIKRSSS